jgi:hypothetical protein
MKVYQRMHTNAHLYSALPPPLMGGSSAHPVKGSVAPLLVTPLVSKTDWRP